MTDPKPDDTPPLRQTLEEQARVALILEGIRDTEGHLFIEGRDISYVLDAEADESVNENNPGEWSPTFALGGKEGAQPSLSIWVWKGVPEAFKSIVLCHEITEGLLVLNYQVPKHAAHTAAQQHHQQYARSHLTDEQLSAFAQWDERLDHKHSVQTDEV